MTRPVVPPTPPTPPPEPPRLPREGASPPPLPNTAADASSVAGSLSWSSDLPAGSVRGPRRPAARRTKFSGMKLYNTLASAWARLTLIGRKDQKAEEQRKRELPSWLVSFVVHVGLILLLALIPLTQMATSQIEMIVGDFDGEGGMEFTLTPEGSDLSLQEVDMPLTTFAANVPEVEVTVPAISPSLTSAKPTEELGANLAGMAMEQGLSGRSGSLKGALLAKYGGNSTTEAAVNLGLKWLASQQLSDGSWSLVKNYSDGAVNEDQTAATAMALNAFLGAGHTHKKGDYKDRVARGLKFLTRRQDKEGFFARGEPSHNQMYSQAIATITLCEAYGMTGDSDLKVPAARALKFAQWSQGRQKGWRYEPREDSDLSVTGWYMMALMTGKMAGLEPDEKVIKSVSEYLELVSHDYGARYSYQRSERPSLSMTAEGLLCRQYLGWPASHPAMQRAIELDLLPNAPDLKAEVVSSYYWYYATQVLHHVGGKAWEEWNSKMRVVLPAMQVKEGKEAGSWDPERDQWGPSGGRLYTTCFALYCLEVYYRHLALYDVGGKPADAADKSSATTADEK